MEIHSCFAKEDWRLHQRQIVRRSFLTYVRESTKVKKLFRPLAR